MRFSPQLLALVFVGAAACGPTYVVQSTPTPAPQRVPVPPRVEPLGVSIVRPDEGRVLIQTSRPAYVAVFEIVPGRGVSLVYPQPMHPREVELTGLTWVNVSWTMRYDSDRRYESYDTRYIYAVGSDTPLRIDDADYDRSGLERRLGSTFYSTSPNATVRAISREFVRAQPDEWWGEDMFSTSMAPTRDRVVISIRFARVYCPGGNYFEVREDLADHVWCPPRVVARGRPPVTEAPDSVFGSGGHRVPRHMDPAARTPIFRVPAATDVGQQQGQPHNPPRNDPPTYPRTQPNNPQTPTTNQPQTPPRNQPPQNQPPQMQPPAQTPPQNQPPQTQPQDTNAQGNHGRRAHGDPRNADPRGNGNGYGNGGREQQPSTQPPSTSNPQPQQQGQSQTPPSNNGRGNGNGNNGNNGNASNNGNNGKNATDAKPNHDDASKNRFDATLKKVNPQAAQKQQDDKNKKAASDSTDKDKKKP
jgi:hypothetical protein